MRLRVLAAGVALSVFPAAARAQQAAPPAAVQGSQSDEEMAEDAVDPGDAIVVEASRRLPGAVIGDIPPDQQARKRVGWGNSVSVRVDLSGSRLIQKKPKQKRSKITINN